MTYTEPAARAILERFSRFYWQAKDGGATDSEAEALVRANHRDAWRQHRELQTWADRVTTMKDCFLQEAVNEGADDLEAFIECKREGLCAEYEIVRRLRLAEAEIKNELERARAQRRQAIATRGAEAGVCVVCVAAPEATGAEAGAERKREAERKAEAKQTPKKKTKKRRKRKQTQPAETVPAESPWEPSPLQRKLLHILKRRALVRKVGKSGYILLSEGEAQREREDGIPQVCAVTTEALVGVLEDRRERDERGMSLAQVRKALSGLRKDGLVEGKADTGKAGWRLTGTGETAATELEAPDSKGAQKEHKTST